ncbi:hypothetical protein SRABI96_03594 [Peribacillus sp. Bi96]|nr:hypothetical protein SRABI96_03594 [Peribacillus sp. Bi96]
MKGLEEKRGKIKGPTIGHFPTYSENTETKIKRFEAEIGI